MKIRKFNEKLQSKFFKPTDKVLKGTIYFEVDTKTIEQTTDYQRHMDRADENYEEINNARDKGILEWLYTSENGTINFELVDGLDNPIEDEEEFDRINASSKKFNL